MSGNLFYLSVHNYEFFLNKNKVAESVQYEQILSGRFSSNTNPPLLKLVLCLGVFFLSTNLKTMTYADKLKDPRWQKKRLEILERDEWACRYCGDKETTLHVHHAYYEKGVEPWETDNFLLTTLCAECHEIEHLVKGSLERMLLDGLRFRMMENGEDIKMLNRVVKREVENG